MKILVVEDDHSIQMVLKLALTSFTSCEVLISSDGRDALRQMNTRSPDLVILDLMLPGMDGFEICQQAKQGPATKDIPIIFLTAQPHSVAAQQAQSLGAAGYLVKPFNPLNLIDQMNGILKKAGSELVIAQKVRAA